MTASQHVPMSRKVSSLLTCGLALGATLLGAHGMARGETGPHKPTFVVEFFGCAIQPTGLAVADPPERYDAFLSCDRVGTETARCSLSRSYSSYRSLSDAFQPQRGGTMSPTFDARAAETPRLLTLTAPAERLNLKIEVTTGKASMTRANENGAPQSCSGSYMPAAFAVQVLAKEEAKIKQRPSVSAPAPAACKGLGKTCESGGECCSGSCPATRQSNKGWWKHCN